MAADEPRDPTLEGLMDLHRDVVRSSMRTTEPGIIVAYDADTQRASVQLAIKSAHLDEFGDRVAQAVSQINDVPVAFIGNARGRITWPVAVGDTCVVWFVSSSMSQWLHQGGIVDPDSDHRHDISDAICMVAGHDFAHVPTDAPTDAIVAHCDDIRLGSSDASDPVALKSDLEAFSSGLHANIAVLQALVATLTSGLPSTATALTAAQGRLDSLQDVNSCLPPGWPTCAQKVKAE